MIKPDLMWVMNSELGPTVLLEDTTLEPSMTELKQSDQSEGLANVSVNSSRRSGVDEDGTGNPAHESGKQDATESIKVPDQQIPVEKSPEIEETEGHPT
jgi:hypothetical protein